MATRSCIIAKVGEHMWKAIYVHWDGNRHLDTLLDNYNTQEKVEELLALGDLSELGQTIETCVAYHRDRCEEFSIVTGCSEYHCSLSFPVRNGIEFVYTWEDGEWTWKAR